MSALDKRYRNRENPEGPTQIWDTESWIANTDDRVGLAVAAFHSMGEVRAMGVYAGNVYSPENVHVGKENKTIVQAWSTAASATIPP